MRRTLTASVLVASFLIPLANAQPDPQSALWSGLKTQLTGPKGDEYFNAEIRGTALPRLRGSLVSALINEGVSRVVLKMPGSSEPDVTLVVHNGSARLKAIPNAGSPIEFEGVAVTFSRNPFMLTFDVGRSNLSGMEFVTTTPKNPALD